MCPDRAARGPVYVMVFGLFGAVSRRSSLGAHERGAEKHSKSRHKMTQTMLVAEVSLTCSGREAAARGHAAERLFDALATFEHCPDETTAQQINHFLEQVSPVVNPAVDIDFRKAGRPPLRPRVNYASSSLISTLCMMAIEDRISESARIVRCEGCGQVIRTTTYQRSYCSDRCKWRTKKRRAAEAKSRLRGGEGE